MVPTVASTPRSHLHPRRLRSHTCRCTATSVREHAATATGAPTVMRWTGKRWSVSRVTRGLSSPRPSYRRIVPVPRSELEEHELLEGVVRKGCVHCQQAHCLSSFVHPAARVWRVAKLEHVYHVCARAVSPLLDSSKAMRHTKVHHVEHLRAPVL